MTRSINNTTTTTTTTTTTEDIRRNIEWFNSLTYEDKVEHVETTGVLDHISSVEDKVAELVRLGVVRPSDDTTTENASIAWFNSLTPEEKIVCHISMRRQ